MARIVREFARFYKVYIKGTLTAVAGTITTLVSTSATIAGATITTANITTNNVGNETIAGRLIEDGRLSKNVEDNETFDSADCGYVNKVTVDEKVITLPAAAAGLAYIIENGGADGAVAITVDPDGTETIVGADLSGGAGKQAINTKATAKKGDRIVLVATTGGWIVQEMIGTWASEE